MKETFVAEQLEIINSSVDSLFISGGRQGGKSYALAWRMAKNGATKPNYNCLYTAKSDLQCCDMYQRVLNNPLTQRNLKHSHGGAHKEIWFKNGSHILFNSTREPKGLKGPTYHEVIFDEVQDSWTREAYEEVAPALTLAKQGIEIFSGQPRTKRHWFFKKYLAGLPKGEFDKYSGQVGLGMEGCKTIVLPTSKGLPYQTEKGRRKLATLKANMSLEFIWERDYECYWVQDDSKLAFREEDVLGCVRGRPMPYNPSHRYILSQDLGGTKDNSAILVYDFTDKSFVFQTKFKGMKHADPRATTDQRREVQKIRNMYGGQRCEYVLDATGGGNPGEPINYARLYQQIMPDVHFQYFNQFSKPDMIMRLKYEIEGRRFSIPKEFEQFIDELCAYECEMKGDKVVYHAPEGTGMHDDFVCACALTFEGIRKFIQHGQPITIPQLVNR